ncbi:hypothetical protein BH10PLA1_BH10PLA1_21440 [soil metagenome]
MFTPRKISRAAVDYGTNYREVQKADAPEHRLSTSASAYSLTGLPALARYPLYSHPKI